MKKQSVATNSPGKGSIENLVGESTVYLKQQKERDGGFQWKQTHTNLFLLLCYLLITLDLPLPSLLAAVQEGPNLGYSPRSGMA